MESSLVNCKDGKCALYAGADPRTGVPVFTTSFTLKYVLPYFALHLIQLTPPPLNSNPGSAPGMCSWSCY